MTLSRRAARRTALFLLYQWDLTGQPLGTNYEGEIDEFARELAEAVAARADELDERISSVSGDWPAKQLGTLERNILRIGVHELEQGTVPARGGDRRSGLACEALRVRGRRPARERNPGSVRAGAG